MARGWIWMPIAAAIAMAPAAAAAASCMDQVRLMARQYSLDIAPAELAPEGPAESLAPVPDAGAARADGMVIEPPATPDPAVIEPPEQAGSRMPTTPDITPEPTEAPHRLAAEDRFALETILMAARAEAERGDAEGCFKRLQRARDFLADAVSE